jgi:hypothetical protein
MFDAFVPRMVRVTVTVLAKGSAILQCKVLRFTPFDPTTKTSEALIADERGDEQRIVKGAPAAIAAIARFEAGATAELDKLMRQGYRVLAVAGGPPGRLALMGLIALSDPPRPDSKALLADLRSMDVHTVMVTGDAASTAATVAGAAASFAIAYWGMPAEGFEPPTYGLQNRCTTTVLSRHFEGRRIRRHAKNAFYRTRRPRLFLLRGQGGWFLRQ